METASFKLSTLLLIAFMTCLYGAAQVKTQALVHASINKTGELEIVASETSSVNDFDFLTGHWLVSMNTFDETSTADAFEVHYSTEKIINGLVLKSYSVPTKKETQSEEVELFLFNPETQLWSIYRADSTTGKLNFENPLRGSFKGSTGIFYAVETRNGIPVIVMSQWDASNPNMLLRSIAYSSDMGKTWTSGLSETFKPSEETRDSRLGRLLTIDNSIPIPEITFNNNDELVIKASEQSSKHDFDFLSGSWKMYHKRLKERLSHSKDWEFLESMDVNYGPTLGGLGNTDLYTAKFNGTYFEGYTLRLFNPETKLWSLYWVASNSGILDPPVVGSIDGPIGHFFCKDLYKGQEVVVVFRWDFRDKAHPVWSQAFSADKGKSWEWNWINVSYRTHELN